MLIRQLGQDCIAEVLALRAIVDGEGTLGRPGERKRALTAEFLEDQILPPSETFGSFLDGTLVGTAAVRRMPECPWDADATSWFGIAAVLVYPDFRKRGIGRALVNECLARATQLGAKGVLLEVNVPNPARALYESLGFEVWNVFEGAYVHEGQSFDQLSMRKRLDAV